MVKPRHRYRVYISMSLEAMESKEQNQAHPDLHFGARNTLARSMSTIADTGLDEDWTEGSSALVLPDVALKPLEEAIEQSRSLLSLNDDWDGEGALGYNEATWSRAADLLRNSARRFREVHPVIVPVPMILPGPDGSIDLHWKLRQRELLLNIPAEPAELANFYGDDRTGQTIKGFLNPADPHEWLLMWLMP